MTQSLQVHFVALPPRRSNHGHGHQNEAAFYILEGAGYEIHDGQRYDWSTDDLVLVHTDSVHRHFNSYDQPATALVVKAKCARVAKRPTGHEIKPGDTPYVPQNTVAQHFAAGNAPLRLISAQNRLFKLLGYDRVVYLEDAPEYGDRVRTTTVSR